MRTGGKWSSLAVAAIGAAVTAAALAAGPAAGSFAGRGPSDPADGEGHVGAGQRAAHQALRPHGLVDGTYISQHATLDSPSRVRRLVLCATDPGGSHYVPPIPPIEKILTNPKGVTTAQLLALSFPPTRAGLKGAASYILRIATQPDLVPDSFTITAAAQKQQELATAAWKAPSGGSYNELPTVKQRTIVLWGDLDLLVKPKNDRIVVRRIPRAHGVVFKGAGHAFLFQDAVSVGRTIDRFLR